MKEFLFVFKMAYSRIKQLSPEALLFIAFRHIYNVKNNFIFNDTIS